MPEQTWSDAAVACLEIWQQRIVYLVKYELETHGPPEVEPEHVDLAVRNAVAKFFEGT